MEPRKRVTKSNLTTALLSLISVSCFDAFVSFVIASNQTDEGGA
ncbi:hypothetical protein SAMN04488030_2107 [Aliiroseovarius halocynthiae]|nr:hypothetical protein SAMN04488030_2107 [Aliiroseovarius halocynthiae]